MRNLQNLLNLSSQGNISNNQFKVLYSLLDQFTTAVAAGSVNNTTAEPTGGIRTILDANSKISIISGKLDIATAIANGSGLWYPIQTRIAGKMFLGEVLPNGAGNTGAGWTTAQSASTQESVRFSTGNTLQVVYDGAGITIGAYTNSTNYKFCVVMRATGMYAFIKGGTEFPNWTLLFFKDNRTSNMFPGIWVQTTTVAVTADNFRIPQNLWLPTPLAYDTFTRANGALGSTETIGPDSQGTPSLVWTGSSWTISSNAAANTLTQGASSITNPSFDTNTTGWTASGATLSSVAGGQVNNCLQVQNTGAAAGYAFQSFTTVVGQWYLLQVYYKNGTGAAGGNVKIGTTQGGSEIISKGLASASFSPRGFAFRATATTTFISLQNFSVTLADNTLFDEVLLVPLTTSELFASLSTSTKDVIIDVNDATAGGIGLSGMSSQAGLVLNLDSASNPQNFIIAYIDVVSTNTAFLIKCVAGVYTTVISGTVTFVSGATLRVIKDGTNYQLFYNNTKVGSTSTISDVGIISNTLHGLFNPTGTNTLDNFSLFPRGSTDNKYAKLDSY